MFIKVTRKGTDKPAFVNVNTIAVVNDEGGSAMLYLTDKRVEALPAVETQQEVMERIAEALEPAERKLSDTEMVKIVEGVSAVVIVALNEKFEALVPTEEQVLQAARDAKADFRKSRGLGGEG